MLSSISLSLSPRLSSLSLSLLPLLARRSLLKPRQVPLLSSVAPEGPHSPAIARGILFGIRRFPQRIPLLPRLLSLPPRYYPPRKTVDSPGLSRIPVLP